MGEVVTEARPLRANADQSSSTTQLVVEALADGQEATLSQLRDSLQVGNGGPTENQLARALRQLVASDAITRPRRGVYVASGAADQLAATDQAAATDRVAPSESAIPTQRSGKDVESLARPLKAAPHRPRRVKRSSESETPSAQVTPAPVVEVVPTVETPSELESDSDVAIESLVETETTVQADSLVEVVPPDDSTAIESAAIEPAAVETEGIEADSAAVAAPSDGEPSVEVPPISEEHIAAAVGDDQEPVSADFTPVIAVEVAHEKRSEHNVVVVHPYDDRRAWLMRAAIPILWFAVTGIALMFLGSIIGVAVGIVAGVGAVIAYRRQRQTQEMAPIDASAQQDVYVAEPVALDNLGVR